ncbi:hypothetical protein EYZ11_005741 [Aspergillus tanneri]|uniref:Hydroxymethylglutaryl-CoA reductase (NADPH) n=1 Tax=Aspergillus tanneri TaxID=1220188 RepID=A0A4S3JHT1_9EURO|nr:hypothetical protein EYZ11_005741 [Aspergillus tanneri]
MNVRDGAERNGQVRLSINVVSILAAMPIASGQNAASVAEASGSYLTVEYDSLVEMVLSIYFPTLPVGVIVGGTAYPTKREALTMECADPGGKRRRSGMIASFALVLEICTTATVATGTFTRSHQKYAGGERAVLCKL